MLVLFAVIIRLESVGGSIKGAVRRHGAVVGWNMTFPSFFSERNAQLIKLYQCEKGYPRVISQD
jgi:hypothetical protein